MVLFSASYCLLSKLRNPAKLYFSLLISMAGFSILSNLYQAKGAWFLSVSLTYLVASCFMAYLLHVEDLDSAISKNYIGFLSSLFIFLIFINYNRNNPLMPVGINATSWIFLSISCFYYIVAFKQNKKTLIWPSLVTLIFSTMTSGRSGILASLILFVGMTWIWFSEKRNKMGYSLLLLALLATTCFSFFNLHYFERLRKSKITEDPRINIASEYLANIDTLEKLMFGYLDKDNLTFKKYEYNLHNSILRAHYSYGLGGFILIIFFVLGTIKIGVKSKKHGVVALALFCRILTDDLAFYASYDFLFYYYILFCFLKHPFMKK